MSRQGLLFIDNNCYSRLRSPEGRARLRANMRVSWLEPAATEVNLLEASATSPPSVEAELIETLRWFADDNPVLEWPFSLLRRIGRALLENRPRLQIGASGREWYLEDDAARTRLREDILAFNAKIEDGFSLLHQRTRPKSQRWLKANGVRREISDLRAFLDDEWPTLDLRDHIARLMWSALGLPGEAPVVRLLDVASWRLLLDAEGAALFARAIVHRQPRFVQRLDLIQLVYLGAAGIRIFATADGPFLAMASQIVNGRYAGARVLHIDEMLA